MVRSFAKLLSLAAATAFAADGDSEADSKCKALVLSGGASNGSWEAGVIWGLVNHGEESDYYYDVVSGVSAGAINTAFMAGFAKSIGEVRGVEFVPISFELADDLAYWKAEIPNLVSAEAEALTVVGDLLKQLSGGADFGALAAEYSTEPQAAQTQGLLGWFKKGQMVKEFEDAALALKAGEISRAVKTQFGYHLIKVHDKKTKFEDFAEEIRQQVLQQQQQQALVFYVEELKQAATITYAEGYGPQPEPISASVSIGNEAPVEAEN